MNTGRIWAYTGVALGATVSVAANIAHSYVRPEDKPASWAPETGAVIGAAFWPLALAVSSEVLARNVWSGRRRALGIGGVVLVAAVAAVVSYLHLKGLLAHYGEPELTAMIGPLAVDGLMLTSTVALIGSDRSGVESIESGSMEEAAPPIAAPPLPPPSSIDDEAAGRPGIGSTIGSRIGPAEPADRVESIGVDGRSDRAESTRSDARSAAAQSTRSPGRSRARRSGRSKRTDDQLRIELAKAQELGLVPKVAPSAESIRVALQCAPKKAAQIRDELKIEPARTGASQDQDQGEVAGG